MARQCQTDNEKPKTGQRTPSIARFSIVRFSFYIHSKRRLSMETVGTIVLIVGIWLVLQFIMRKAGLPT